MTACSTLGAISCSLVVAAAAQAQTAGPRYDFLIPAGSLDSALRLYARTTGRQLLYRPEAVRGLRTVAVAGSLDADQALKLILEGTGLGAERPAPNVIVLTPERVAQPAEEIQPADLVVTGSNIREGAPVTATTTIGRREIERSGKATIADAISTLTANFGGAGNPVAALTGSDAASLNFSVAPAANLRGLGSDATLTLFDGRRVAGSGGRGDFVDLSAIPTIAVDRVEVLADGASAIYGSDAVGGVVNMLMRHRLDGPEVRFRVERSTDGRVWNGLAGGIVGQAWSSGSVVVAYEYEHRDALSSADRRYSADGDLRPFGGSDRRTFYSSPGTILSFDPASGALAPVLRIPRLPVGTTLTSDQLQPGSNLYNPLAGLDLSPGIDRHAVYAHAEQRLGNGGSMFVDARYAHRRFGYFSPASVSAFAVTPANPFYVDVDGAPFSIVAYSFYPELGPVRTRGVVEALGITAGLDHDLGSAWRLAGHGSFSVERGRERTRNVVNASALDEALGTVPDDPRTPFSTAASGFFNPYGSGASNDAGVLAFVGSGFSSLSRRSSIVDVNLKADGPVVRLPGGALRAAIGANVRRETFDAGGETFFSGSDPSVIARLRGGRTVKAAFAELNVPLVDGSAARPGMRSLVLSAAARHEHYSDFGSTTNPRVGIVWRPAEDLSLRVSWGTSFRAPALAEINDRRSISPTQLPEADGRYVPVIFVGGGNLGLGPERATTWSFGGSVRPAGIPGLTMDLNVFSTAFKDRIGQPALQDILQALVDPALAPFVERVAPATNPADLARIEALLAEPNAASAGGIPASAFQAVVDGRYVNTGRLSVSGLDGGFAVARRLGTAQGDLGVNATWLFRYDDQATPGSPVVRRLDTLGNPAALRVRANVGMSKSKVAASLFANWVSGYRDDSVTPFRRIASFTTVDATVVLGPFATGPLAGFRLLLTAQNLLDADPPFVDRSSGIGFDAANASPFGRALALELRRAF